MATITSKTPVPFQVPARYLADFRRAALALVQRDSDFLGKGLDIDLPGDIRQVGHSFALVVQLADAEGDTTVTAAPEELSAVVAELGRLWTAELADAWGYEPDDAEHVLAALERLRWCAEQALAIAVQA